MTRISAGTGIAPAAYALVRRAAHELLAKGAYTSMRGGLDYADLNALFTG